MSEKLPRNFFWIYFSNMFLGIAVSLFFIFILLSLWHSYNSALIASLPFILMSAIPSFLSPIIGTHVDRYSKRKIGLYSLIFSFISLIPMIFLHNIVVVVVIFAILLFFESYYNTNYTICVRNIVGDEKLMYANNLWVVSIGITYVIAYILGAYLYSYMTFSVVLMFVSVFYLLSLGIWIFTRVPETKRIENKKVKYSEIWQVLRRKKHLISLILIYDVAFLFIVLTKTPAYLPYFFNILKTSSFVYGAFNGVTAFLFVIVPLILHRFIKIKSVNKYALLSFFGDGFITLFIASIPFIFSQYIFRITILFAVLVFGTFFSTLEMDSFLTIFQKAVPTEILGRFYSVRSLFRGVVNISAYIVGGYIADVSGPIIILVFSGILVIALTFPLKKNLELVEK